MSWTIIVASGDGDQRDELVNGALEISKLIVASGDGASVEAASCVDDVRKLRIDAAGRRQLLIVAATLPQLQSSPDRNAEPGVDLVKSIAQEPDPPACILVSDRLEHNLATQGLKRCKLLAVGSSTNYVEQCLILARELEVVPAGSVSGPPEQIVAKSGNGAAQVPVLVSPSISAGAAADAGSPVACDEAEEDDAEQSGSAPKRFALLEVELLKGRRAKARLQIGEGEKLDPRKVVRWLDFDPNELDGLVTESREIRERLSHAFANPKHWERYRAKWPTEYRTVGEGFAKLLWETPFKKLYSDGRKYSDNNMRLRFTLDGKSLDGLWEAMLDIRRDSPLMIQNTITRRAGRADEGTDDPREEGGNDRCNIGGDDGVLNILVVKSAVLDNSSPQSPGDWFWKEYWAKKGQPKRKLRYLDKEVDVLKGLAGSRPASGEDAGLQVHVDILERPTGVVPSSWSLADEMERKLDESGRHYDIVHFAGHAEFATHGKKNDEQGYLIFSGQDQPYAVPIEEVVGWVEEAQVQLLYLSCCHSNSASAGLEFARANVPMTIGFNWDLEDDKAVAFTNYFYRALLAKRNELKVCLAMSEARRKLYKKYKRDTIWASPVLIAQPHWSEVEAVFRSPVGVRPPPNLQPTAARITVAPGAPEAAAALHG